MSDKTINEAEPLTLEGLLTSLRALVSWDDAGGHDVDGLPSVAWLNAQDAQAPELARLEPICVAARAALRALDDPAARLALIAELSAPLSPADRGRIVDIWLGK